MSQFVPHITEGPDSRRELVLNRNKPPSSFTIGQLALPDMRLTGVDSPARALYQNSLEDLFVNFAPENEKNSLLFSRSRFGDRKLVDWHKVASWGKTYSFKTPLTTYSEFEDSFESLQSSSYSKSVGGSMDFRA
ncbi:hypothetical protein TNCV_2915701 [Trichonephila clavipes]|nr:hypothetical protein TNCV_2915701 [Trichonephila clavipes]